MREHYINFVLEEYISSENFDSMFGQDWVDGKQLEDLYPTVCDFAFADYGIDAQGKYTEEVTSILEGMIGSGIIRQGDDYADYWYKLRPISKTKHLDERKNKNPAFKRVSQIGEESLRRALNKIAAEDNLRSMEEKWIESDPRNNENTEVDNSQNYNELSDASLNANYFKSEDKKAVFVSRTDQKLQEVEDAELTNAERSQARGYLLAVRALADTPEPPPDIIWDILHRAASIVGIASFFLTLIALIAAG